ncbi:MAG: V-type ATPase 116kDa subunit family protein, partial [Blautia sp.]|nr:V-type ATPase 116kDa subunit family protein [Blautia sp.]
LGVMFGVPLLLIMFKEPITRILTKKGPAIEGSKAMFLVQSFFELFEIMLSFLSNTLSFVRIGAFAVSHAAMMGVVLMLAGAEDGGSINWLIIILGNLFVCAMEGLIVGIQVLRLEYYEMFSRFYKGSGKEFQPFFKNTVTK